MKWLDLICDPVAWDGVAQRYLHPQRPRLLEVLASLCGCEEAEVAPWIERNIVGKQLRAMEQGRLPLEAIDPLRSARRAWEVLAPESWHGNTQRVFSRSIAFFYSGRYPKYSVTTNLGRITDRHPYSLSSVVALCSDPDGIVTAEELARELMRRVGYVRPVRVLWRVCSVNDIERNAWPVEFVPSQCAWSPVPVFFALRALSSCFKQFARGTALGIADALAEVTPDNARSPLDVLFPLLSTGYCVGDVSPDTIELLCPEIPPPKLERVRKPLRR